MSNGSSQKKSIFRKEALDRLSSPERLDELIQVTSPRSWLALIAVFLLLLAFMAWGVLGTVRTRVTGYGIILGGKLYEVATATSSGQILDLRKKVGDDVGVNDPVADVDQPELYKQIQFAVEVLHELREEQQAVESFASRELALQDRYFAERRKDLEGNIQDDRELLALLQEQLGREQNLRDGKVIAEADLLPTRESASETRERLDRAQAELNQLKSVQSEKSFELQQKRLAVEQRVNDAERRVQELRQRYELGSVVRSPHRGRILEIMADKGSVITPGQALMKLSVPDDNGNELYVVLYVNGEDGKRIENRMAVQVAPANVRPEQHGYLLGEVTDVAPFPSGTSAMQHVLKNDRLVSKLATTGTPFRVEVRLRGTAPAYEWSSGKDPGVAINDGTLAQGLITVEERAPIQLIIPTIKKKLSLF